MVKEITMEQWIGSLQAYKERLRVMTSLISKPCKLNSQPKRNEEIIEEEAMVGGQEVTISA